MDQSTDNWSEWAPTCHLRRNRAGRLRSDLGFEQRWERTRLLEDGSIEGEEAWRVIEETG